MSHEEHFRKLERMYQSAPFNSVFSPTLLVSQGRAVVTLPVRRGLFHAAGALHGSVYFKAMDDAAFFACASLVTDVFVLTASYEVELLRPVTGGEITAIGRVHASDERSFLADARLYDSQEQEVGRGRGRFVRSRIPLGPEVGYR
jgi:uncharacterized protein (TIGR00369 family)